MLVLAEIVIYIVFAAALLAACGCLAYLVTLTLRERHLRPGLAAAQPQGVGEAAQTRRKSARVPARHAAKVARRA